MIEPLELPLPFEDLATAHDVEAALHALYRERLPAGGILQAMAVAPDQFGTHRVIAIGEDTPRSRHDRFVLNATRARADAVITTGAILRSEPSLTSGLLGTGPEVEALARWAAAEAGGTAGTTLVLTSGRNLDPTHPIFTGGDVLVYTGHESAAEITGQLLELGVEVVSHDEPSVASAVEYLLEERGVATIAIEAGSNTSIDLYRPPRLVTEVLLTVFSGPLEPSLLTGPFPGPGELSRSYPKSSPPATVTEPSGEWTFYRFAGQR